MTFWTEASSTMINSTVGGLCLGAGILTREGPAPRED